LSIEIAFFDSAPPTITGKTISLLLAALQAIAINPATTGHFLPFVFAIDGAPGPVAAAAKAALIALLANNEALAAMAAFGGDVNAVVLAAAAAAAGGNNADQGQAVFEEALKEVLVHNAPFTPEEKLILSLAESAVNQPLGNEAQQRQMIANGIAAAYAGSPDAFAQTWANPEVLGVNGFMKDGGLNYVNKAAAFVETFKKNIVGGFQVAPAAGSDAEKLSRIYDVAAARVGNDKIASKLKAMVDKAVDPAYYPNDKTMLALQAAIGDYTAAGQGFPRGRRSCSSARCAAWPT
jgi:hypothetical protein